MTRLLKHNSAIGFGLLFLLVAAMVLYTRGIETRQHLGHLDSIDQLLTAERQYNIQLLQSRQQLQRNLDPLMLAESHYQLQLEQVAYAASALDQHDRERFTQQLSTIQQLLERKRDHVIQFKANRSIHYNSLLYLPHISQRMEDFSHQGERTIPLEAHDTFEEVLIYLGGQQTSFDKLLAAVNHLLTKIEAEGDNASLAIHDAESVLRHIKITLTSYDTMNRQLNQSLAITLEQEIEQLRTLYLQGYRQVEERNQIGNRVLLLITFILFIGVIHTLKKMREQFRELQQLQAAIDQHAIVSSADVYGNITYVNDKFCEISGFSREELMGNNHRLVKSGRHPDAFYHQLWETVASGKTWQGEIWNRKKGGDYYSVFGTIMPFSDLQGRITKYVSVRTDLTELKQSELELKQSREKFQGLVEDIGSGYVIFSVDPRRYVARLLSREFEPLFGVAADQALGHSLLTTVSWAGNAVQLLEQALSTTLAEGRSEPFEVSFQHAESGVLHTISITQHRVDKEGEIVAVEGIIQDITERLLAEQRQYEAFQAGVAEMSASVLHSIGNTITGLTGHIQGIDHKTQTLESLARASGKLLQKHEEGTLTETELVKALGLIRESIDKAINQSEGGRGIRSYGELLKEGLKNITSHIEAYRGISEQSTVHHCIELKKLARDALQLTHDELAQQEIECVNEITDGLCIKAPTNQSLQLLVNLLNNSIQAIRERRSTEATLVGRVTLKTQALKGNRVLLSLEDNGCGIRAEHKPHIFNHGYSSRMEGSGLGLHSAGNLMAKLGGTIQVESDGHNCGTTVSLIFVTIKGED